VRRSCVEGGGDERLTFFFLDGHLENAHGLAAEAIVGVDGRLRDLSTTSMPSLTRAEGGELAIQRRLRRDADENCAPSLSGLPGMLTVETTPRSCLRSLNSGAS